MVLVIRTRSMRTTSTTSPSSTPKNTFTFNSSIHHIPRPTLTTMPSSTNKKQQKKQRRHKTNKPLRSSLHATLIHANNQPCLHRNQSSRDFQSATAATTVGNHPVDFDILHHRSGRLLLRRFRRGFLLQVLFREHLQR